MIRREHKRGEGLVRARSCVWRQVCARTPLHTTIAPGRESDSCTAGREEIAKRLHAESSSTIDYSSAADGSETVEIRNVSHEVTGTGIPGRPPDERLLLRKITRSKQVLSDIKYGGNPRSGLFVASRGLEETEWWSVYQLGSGGISSILTCRFSASRSHGRP